MSYAVWIKPFQIIKNERDEFIALVAQYSEVHNWQKLLKDSANILINRRWSGQGMFMLDKFISVHRNSYGMITQGA